MRRETTLVSGSKRTADFLFQQLQEYLPPDTRLKKQATENKPNQIISGDLVIFSSDELYDELVENGQLGNITQAIVCNRSINFDKIEEIVSLPRGMKVLFVNDSVRSAGECIADLQDLGLNHLVFYPYYPGIEEDPKAKEVPDIREFAVAITAGEADKVPKEIANVIDMGARIIDIISLYKIFGALGLNDLDAGQNIKKYLKKIVNISQKVAENSIEIASLRKNLQQELLLRGYKASYTFDDIIGRSKEILDAKEKAKRLANTELTILIEGESGTGKELFAAAMHNASARKDRAFLAVNFSALPEELVESELFGYEEGAFTGARRGGKRGLFEMAHGGTLFLDEIGDISTRVQIRLLRVLQEKEIMAVGGSVIKKVDIRIIAATNKNLEQLVEENKFRADLYYRLKVGQVRVPPLRERKEDITSLVNLFLQQEAPGETLTMDREAMKIIKSWDWRGNVRELQNVIKYMAAVRRSEMLTVMDFPDAQISIETLRKTEDDSRQAMLTSTEKMILEAIEELSKRGEPAGRERIAKLLNEKGVHITPGRVKGRLVQLREKGYIQTRHGRSGAERL